MAKIVRLRINGAEVRQATLTDTGLLGDKNDGSPRPVSLLACEAVPGISAAGGHCASRFYANLETQDLNYSALRAGDILMLGEARLALVQLGKTCHAVCTLHSACPLLSACAFAEVIKSGKESRLAPGMEVIKA